MINILVQNEIIISLVSSILAIFFIAARKIISFSKTMKIIVGVIMIITFPGVASAILHLKVYNQTSSEITFIANNIQFAPNGCVSLLKGNVELHIGHTKKIIGNDVSIKYSSDKPKEIVECIIKGKGLIEEGDHIYEVKNAIFNLKNLQISAEKIKTLK